MFKTLILVGSGGFIGSVARYYISKIVQESSYTSFPIGTLSINIIGSLLIGFLLGLALKYPSFSVEWRMVLMVGFCGGFTTFSTFTSENFKLMQDGQFFYVLMYTGLSILLGFSAVYLGYIVSKII
ncbi:MAG TPA: fluoride efflux transporter CrcB [Bacteroidales bacterium]|jgi:CrcB protein|nr:fluoride efflux transporter CrcB [Bacteroidales bacterium]